MQSGGPGIKAPPTAESGTTVEIEVQNGAIEIEVGVVGDKPTTKIPVGPDGKCSVPVPFNSAGRRMNIRTSGKPPDDHIVILITSTD